MMKRILLPVIFLMSTFFVPAQTIDLYEHEAFIQGYMQSLQNEQLKFNHGKIEFYHKRSILQTVLLGMGIVGGAGMAVVPLLALKDEAFFKIFCGAVGAACAGLCIYQLDRMYSNTPLVVLSNEGLQVPGKLLISWSDISEVALTQNIEEISTGNSINSTGFIGTTISSTQQIVIYGVVVRNKYGQTVYSETEKALPVEATSFCTLVNHYLDVYNQD